MDQVLQGVDAQEVVETDVADEAKRYLVLAPSAWTVTVMVAEDWTVTSVVVPDPEEQAMVEGLGEGEPPDTVKVPDVAPLSASEQSMGRVTVGAQIAPTSTQ